MIPGLDHATWNGWMQRKRAEVRPPNEPIAQELSLVRHAPLPLQEPRRRKVIQQSPIGMRRALSTVCCEAPVSIYHHPNLTLTLHLYPPRRTTRSPTFFPLRVYIQQCTQ